LPAESEVPRRFRCQPDLALATAIDKARAEASQKGITLSDTEEQAIRARVRSVLKPLFESQQYGDPEYAQLERRCPVEIRTGGENGGEMGAFSFLEQPQREANLRGALTEYLRFGLEAGVFFVT
jgi:hypothetical protein